MVLQVLAAHACGSITEGIRVIQNQFQLQREWAPIDLHLLFVYTVLSVPRKLRASGVARGRRMRQWKQKRLLDSPEENRH